MKRLILFMAFMLMGVLTFAQDTFTVSANSEDISQNLDLKVVAKLFAEAESVEQFEVMLNNPDSAFSNLDLNGDGNIDYLRVVESGSTDSRLIIIQAVLAQDIYQDVASIYVQKDEQNKVTVQIIGDEYVYGTNYIIEPVYVYRPVIYTYLWSSLWHPWYSPWYWNYYPHWWYHRHCYSYHWYYDRCYRFHHHHHAHCSFHHGHHPHHGYHEMHGNISHREYATAHPDRTFTRRTNVVNAREIQRTSSVRSTVTREPNQTVRSHPSTNRSTNIRTTQPTEHRSTGATRTTSRSTSQTQTRGTSTRTTQPVQRSTSVTRTQTTTRSTSTRTSQPTQTTRTSSNTRTSSTPVRTSSPSPSSRGSGSAPRSGGGRSIRR